MKNIRVLLSAAAAIFVTTLLASWVMTAPVVQAEKKPAPFVLGVILPLSGSYASLGSGMKAGIDFALSQIPAAEKNLLEVVVEDDQLDPAKSLAAFQKLRKLNNAHAFIIASSGIGHVLAPLAEAEQVPLIAVGASDFTVVKGRSFAFTHWVTPEMEARALAGEIKHRGYSRLAMATAEQAGWIALYDALMTQFKEQGLLERIVVNDRFLPNDTDFRTFLAKARNKNTDGIIFLVMPEPVVALVKQTRQAGINADLIGCEMFEDDSVIKSVGDLLTGQWYVTADSAIPSFAAELHSFSGQQPTFGTANGYDAFNLLVQGGLREGLRAKALADFLRNLKDYQGASGFYSATGDNRFALPAAVKRVIKGGFEKIS